MSKNKFILGLVGLLSACATGSSGSYSGSRSIDWSSETSFRETSKPSGPGYVDLSKDKETRHKEKSEIGQFISDKLKGECDKVEYYLIEATKKDYNGRTMRDSQGNAIVEDEKLAIRCYEKDSGKDWPIWGVSLDTVCRSVFATSYFWKTPIRLKDIITVETSNGDVISTNDLKNKVAEVVSTAIGMYAPNNLQTCQDYANFIKTQIGPGGDGI